MNCESLLKGKRITDAYFTEKRDLILTLDNSFTFKISSSSVEGRVWISRSPHHARRPCKGSLMTEDQVVDENTGRGQLEAIGAVYGVRKRHMESDSGFRLRILRSIRSGKEERPSLQIPEQSE